MMRRPIAEVLCCRSSVQDCGVHLLFSYTRCYFAWIPWLETSQEYASRALLRRVSPLSVFSRSCHSRSSPFVPFIIHQLLGRSEHTGDYCVYLTLLLMWQILKPWEVTITWNFGVFCRSASLPLRMSNQIPFPACRMEPLYVILSTW